VKAPQRRDETLLDIGEEPRAIDRAVKDAWRFDLPAARLAAYQIVWFENVLAVRKPYQ
jgi:hypothetical protein